MKFYLVEYKSKTQSFKTLGYQVVAENADIAEHVGLEHLENEGFNPNAYDFSSCHLLERCSGCGGMRKESSPAGQGAVQ